MTGERDQATARTPAWRLHAVRAMAIILVVLALLPESASSAPAEDPTTPPSQTVSVDETSGQADSVDTVGSEEQAAVPAPLTIIRLWSPGPNTARVEGSIGPGGPSEVEVSADGIPITTTRLQIDGNGRFAFSIDGLNPGAQTLCLDAICDRVFVADPATESPFGPESQIERALENAAAAFDWATHLPGWNIEATGPNSDTGGYTVFDDKSIFISANPGRSTDEFTITVLHELGHAVDATWMDDNSREQFRTLRAHDPSLPWGESDVVLVGEDRWQDSAEDFAEVFVAWVMAGGYNIESQAVASQPTASDLVAFCRLIAIDNIECG